MKLLAIETTGPYASVAYWTDGMEKPVQKTASGTFSHLQSTLPLAKELLEEEGAAVESITHIACSRGPGSFTGIRIGMTAARTLGQVLQIPVIAVPTLESFGYKAPQGKIACPLFDARRSQVYAGAYEKTADGVHTLVAENAYAPETYLEQLREACKKAGIARSSLVFYGDGIAPYQFTVDAFLQGWESESAQTTEADTAVRANFFAPESSRYQEAREIALWAVDAVQKGLETPWNEAEPVYLRKAEAERKLPEGKKQTLEQAADTFAGGEATRGARTEKEANT